MRSADRTLGDRYALEYLLQVITPARRSPSDRRAYTSAGGRGDDRATTVISFWQTSCRFASRATAHEVAVARYSSLRAKISNVCASNTPDRAESVSKLFKEKDDTDRSAPSIPPWISGKMDCGDNLGTWMAYSLLWLCNCFCGQPTSSQDLHAVRKTAADLTERLADNEESAADASPPLFTGHINGVNIPNFKDGWDFGSVEWYEGDAPKPSTPRICFDQDTEEYYTKAFKAVKDKGGNLVRFWLFFDGRAAPRFDLSHDSLRDNVLGWDEEVAFQKDFRKLLTAAKEAKIQLLPVLWSFHALDATAYRPKTAKDKGHGRSKNQGIDGSHIGLFEAGPNPKSGEHADKFVAKILKPLVTMCENEYPGIIFAWDIFNEPEYVMSSAPDKNEVIDGMHVQLVSKIGMQTFVAKCAVGIHEAKSRATVGSAKFNYCWDSNAGSKPANNGFFTNYWSDAQLKERCNNNPQAFLDFYQVHYYKKFGDEINPAKHTIKEFIADDKQVLIGEIAVKQTELKDAKTILGNGFMGVLYWAYKENRGETEDYGAWSDIGDRLRLPS
ncbi:g13146 [Coccomyxa viridis]|uniref:G13146 protein n=1 Tax=Coccomyxa viridis TaxID=1274662 RepID=A0ABP1GD39_9CHLO